MFSIFRKNFVTSLDKNNSVTAEVVFFECAKFKIFTCDYVIHTKNNIKIGIFTFFCDFNSFYIFITFQSKLCSHLNYLTTVPTVTKLTIAH